MPTKPRPEPSLRDQLAVVRKLIDERHFDEALALLRTIDHPTAREWEERVRQKQGGRERMTVVILGAAVVALLIAVVVLAGLLVIGGNRRENEGRAVVDAVSTWANASTSIARYAATEYGARATLDAMVLPSAGEIAGTTSAGERIQATFAVNAQATLSAAERSRRGGLDNPIQAGDRIDYESGVLRVLSVERPASFVLFRGNEIAPPPDGMTYIGVELEFTCSATSGGCASPPEAQIALALSDGTPIQSDPERTPRDAPLLNTQPLQSGGVARGWRFFAVPTNAATPYIQVTTPVLEQGIYAALPPSVDGYALETAWATAADNSRQRRFPAFRRALENAGFVVDEVYLRQPPDSGARIVFTASLDVLDEAAAREAVRPLMFAAAGAWETFRDSAPAGIGVQLRNYRASLNLGTVGISGSDLLAYANGALDMTEFESRWIIVNP